MRARLAQGHRLDQRMQTEAGHHADRDAPVQMMGMAMLHTHGERFQNDLHKKTRQNERADEHMIISAAGHAGLIEFRQEMEKNETEQVGSGESIEQLDVAPILQFENENRQRTDENAGKQEKVVHESVSARCCRLIFRRFYCKSFAVAFDKKPPSGAGRTEAGRLLHQEHLARALDGAVELALVVGRQTGVFAREDAA